MATIDDEKKKYSTEYTSPTYSDSYRDGVDTSYYTNAIQKYTDAQEKNRATQTAQAQQQQTNALREAYITKMQNQKSLNENLAKSGIRGGATETSNLKLANTYAQQRNAANTDYTNSVNSINQAIDSNILNYDMDMTSRAEEYTQNMAQAKWQAAREDYANAIAQQNWAAEMTQTDEQNAIQNESQKLQDKLTQQTLDTNANETKITNYVDKFSRFNTKRLKNMIKYGTVDGTKNGTKLTSLQKQALGRVRTARGF